MLLVLICKYCGRHHNPETYDGIVCEDCGGELIPTIIIPENGGGFDRKEPPIIAS